MTKPDNEPKIPKGPGRPPERLNVSHAVPIPEDTSKEEWGAWPRQFEAHLVWGCRARQISAKINAGTLTLYHCTDGTFRLDPEQLEECFGPPSQGGRAARGAWGKRTLKEPEIDSDDPLPSVIDKFLQLLNDSREDNRKILQMVLDPASKHVTNLLDSNDRLTKRITDLENRWQMDQERRGEELAQLRAFELERQKAENQEKRRAEIMKMLQSQLPTVLSKLAGGPSVADFLTDLPEETIELMLVSDMLAPEKRVQLRAAYEQLKLMKAAAAKAGAKQPGAPSAPMNGAPSA